LPGWGSPLNWPANKSSEPPRSGTAARLPCRATGRRPVVATCRGRSPAPTRHVTTPVRRTRVHLLWMRHPTGGRARRPDRLLSCVCLQPVLDRSLPSSFPPHLLRPFPVLLVSYSFSTLSSPFFILFPPRCRRSARIGRLEPGYWTSGETGVPVGSAPPGCTHLADRGGRRRGWRSKRSKIRSGGRP